MSDTQYGPFDYDAAISCLEELKSKQKTAEAPEGEEETVTIIVTRP